MCNDMHNVYTVNNYIILWINGKGILVYRLSLLFSTEGLISKFVEKIKKKRNKKKKPSDISASGYGDDDKDDYDDDDDFDDDKDDKFSSEGK